MKRVVKDSQVERVVFAWSATDLERRIDQASVVIPLAAEGFIAAKRSCSAKVIDTDTVMGAAREVGDTILIASQAVEEALETKEPWMAGHGGHTLEIVMGQLLLWDKLMDGIRRMMDKVPVEIVPPLAFERPSMLRQSDWTSIMDRESFWICLKSFARRGRVTVSSVELGKNNRYQFLKRTVSSLAGYFIVRMARFLLRERSKERCFQRPAKTELLLVGTQTTDAVHQAPLAQRLSARFGKAFHWLSFSEEEIAKRAVITPEEKSLFDGTGNKDGYWISSDAVPKLVWRHRLFSRLANAYTAWSMAGILSKTVQSSLSRLDWFDRFSKGEFSNLRARYERWRRFLDTASPRIIVGLSSIEDMAFIRSWARSKAVPFVLLPHGVFPSIRSKFQVDGDYLGVFGGIMAEQVQASGISKAREVVVCGSMQFGKRTSPRSGIADSEKVSRQRSLLYVASCSFFSFFPCSVVQRFREIEGLHRACLRVGSELIVREHPRGGENWLAPFVEELERRFPGTARVSKEPSLFKDFACAAAVVASEFDGAVLNALLAGEIVVMYLSQHSWNPFLEIVEQMGCFVRNENELERVLRVVLENGKEATEIRQREQEFLNKYIDGPSEDPWARAETLIANAFDKARSEYGCSRAIY